MKADIPVGHIAEDFMSYAKKINPNKQGLTIEVLKTFPGCEHYTDEEAAEIVQGIEQLTLIIFEITQKESYCIDNQIDVSLEPGEAPETIPIPIKANIKNKAA